MTLTAATAFFFFFPGDLAPRPLAAPQALLPVAALPFSRLLAWSAPPAVEAAAASVPALGTRTFLNIPRFPGRALSLWSFSELLSYLVLSYQSWGGGGGGGHARAGRGFSASAASDGGAESGLYSPGSGAEALEALRPHRKVVGSEERTDP